MEQSYVLLSHHRKAQQWALCRRCAPDGRAFPTCLEVRQISVPEYNYNRTDPPYARGWPSVDSKRALYYRMWVGVTCVEAHPKARSGLSRTPIRLRGGLSPRVVLRSRRGVERNFRFEFFSSRTIM